MGGNECVDVIIVYAVAPAMGARFGVKHIIWWPVGANVPCLDVRYLPVGLTQASRVALPFGTSHHLMHHRD